MEVLFSPQVNAERLVGDAIGALGVTLLRASERTDNYPPDYSKWFEAVAERCLKDKEYRHSLERIPSDRLSPRLAELVRVALNFGTPNTLREMAHFRNHDIGAFRLAEIARGPITPIHALPRMREWCCGLNGYVERVYEFTDDVLHPRRVVIIGPQRTDPWKGADVFIEGEPGKIHLMHIRPGNEKFVALYFNWIEINGPDILRVVRATETFSKIYGREGGENVVALYPSGVANPKHFLERTRNLEEI